MFWQCWSACVLLHGAIFMLKTKPSSALISGQFNPCSESSCNSSLSSRPCAVDKHGCKCAVSQNSACDTLDQQSFVNITGKPNVSASQWTCCWCPQNTSYCCDKCISTTAPPATTLPTPYYRVILVFMLVDCHQLLRDEQQLNTSLDQGVTRLSRIPLVHVTGIACLTGQQPYCGVDVENIRAHHRAKRLVGSRTRGKGSKSNNDGNSKNSYHEPTYLNCSGLAANITVEGTNRTKLETSLGLLRHLLSNNSLVIPLWDGRRIHPSFMLSAMGGKTYSLHHAPVTDQPSNPTDDQPPIEVDLKPLFFALGGILGLVSLCVLWKFLKHSWLLHKRKFTPINSDRVDHKKVRQLQRTMEAMEENDSKSTANGSSHETTSTSLRRGENEANGSLARSLAPAYTPTEPHMQRTPPKLILDDDESDMERQSIGSASELNMEDDENLSDILNSDDERVLQDSKSSSRLFHGIGNPGFTYDNAAAWVREGNKDVATKNGDKNKSKTTSPRLANGHLYSELNVSSNEERKGSVVSSDLSSNADENTDFLSLKSDKTIKQPSEKPKKSKSLLSPSNTGRNVRRSSISPLNERKHSLKQSETEVKTKKKPSTLQEVKDPEKRKSVSATDYEMRVVTPKDKYTKRGKNTKALRLENELKEDDGTKAHNGEMSTSRVKDKLATSATARRKSMISADEDITVSKKNEEKNDRLTALASSGRRKSVNVDRKDVRSSENDNRLNTQASGRRSSSLTDEGEVASSARKPASSVVMDEGDAKGSDKNKTRKTESRDVENSKRKKKKLKTQKENKNSVEDLDDMSDLEEEVSMSRKDFTSLNVIPASPEMQRSTSVTTGDSVNKKKKKKRKEREATKRKNEDSEHSDEDVEDMIRQLNENFVSPETTRRMSVAPEETERKKKKAKKGKSTRNRSEKGAVQSDEETNGDFTRRVKNLKAETLSVKPEKKRKKSLVLEEMEGN